MELIPIVHNDNDTTINDSFSESNNNQTNYLIGNKQEDSKNRLLFLYNICKMTSIGLLHTFLLSIFETVFYWTYITNQERLALLRRLDDFKFILDIFCVTLDNEEIKKLVQEYIDNSDNQRIIDNQGPLKTSIILSVILFILSLLILFITLLVRNLVESRVIKYEKKKVGICFFSKEYILNVRNSIPLFIFISIYEFLFFQMVIYYYQPISSHELITRLASNCIG